MPLTRGNRRKSARAYHKWLGLCGRRAWSLRKICLIASSGVWFWRLIGSGSRMAPRSSRNGWEKLQHRGSLMLQRPGEVEDVHIFNDDLLVHRKDLEFVWRRFPTIAHILDNQPLREEFCKYERVANEARGRVRLYGFIAVMASTVALLALATRPLWPHSSWMHWPAGIIEFVGMFAAIIAIGGLWSGNWKRKWLTSRLMTERLRQWHFQLIVRCGREVEVSCTGEEAIEEFKQKRDTWLQQFLIEFRGHLDSQLESVINDPLEKIVWLHEHPSSYGQDSAILKEVDAAYELLRLNHQYGYAVHKMESTTDKPFWMFLQWPSNVQRAVLSGISSSFFITALVLSVLLVCENLFVESEQVEAYLRTGAIVVAIIGAALRTIQDGLGLDGEIDRYREYREKISRVIDRFKHSSDDQHRMHLDGGSGTSVSRDNVGFLSHIRFELWAGRLVQA